MILVRKKKRKRKKTMNLPHPKRPKADLKAAPLRKQLQLPKRRLSLRQVAASLKSKNLRVRMMVLLMMVVVVITNRMKVLPSRKRPSVVFVAALKSGNVAVQIFLGLMKMAQVQVR